ncbi:MAG: ABC transporter permease [Clostridia bacterium]|nr:ABC transporter permease [Clostridia bacterium]
MKMFLKIIKYRFIASLKHPVVLICLIGALICSAVVGIYADKNESDDYRYPIAVVDEDGAEYADEFISQLQENNQISILLTDRETALKYVSTGRLDGAFILLDGFTDKIEENDFTDIVEFISPEVTTSAYPVSEIVSSEILDLWLMQLVKSTLLEMHDNLGEAAQISYEEALSRIETDYKEEDIITIEYIGGSEVPYENRQASPLDRAVGVYASFVIFAVMLSGEWIFNIKKKSLKSRFESHNIGLPMVCMGSQIASILISMVFFVPLVVFLSLYMHTGVSETVNLSMGMLLFSLGICAMAFVVSTLVENLTQLVVVGTSVSIINILLSSLAMPLPDWAGTAKGVAKILPGTYLHGCWHNESKLTAMLIISIGWLAVGYLATVYISRTAKS